MAEYTVVSTVLHHTTSKVGEQHTWKTYRYGEIITLEEEAAAHFLKAKAIVPGTEHAIKRQEPGVAVLDPQEATGTTAGAVQPEVSTFDADAASYPELQAEAKRLELDATGTAEALRERIKGSAS
jgi:hypothetical protein